MLVLPQYLVLSFFLSFYSGQGLSERRIYLRVLFTLSVHLKVLFGSMRSDSPLALPECTFPAPQERRSTRHHATIESFCPRV